MTHPEPPSTAPTTSLQPHRLGPLVRFSSWERQLPASIKATLALLVGAWLRLTDLTELGLAHDEVAHWLIDRAILAGQHSPYFSQAYGHEAGFHYLEALSLTLLGDHSLALRLPAALSGMVGLAVSYALLYRLFGRRPALLALWWLSLTFWPVFYSRLALRAISLPVAAGLSALFFWQGLHHNRRRAWGLAGVWGGLSLYTYLASRALPLFYLSYLLYLAAAQRPQLRRVWRGLLLFAAVYTLVALPLVVYLQTHPNAEFRVAEVDAPLEALRQGNPQPILTNALGILGAFGWRGDPLWRQNVAGAPVFDPLTATLFYLGVGLTLRRGQPQDWFVLLWAAASVTPSLATVDAPSTIRMILLLPILGIFPSQVIHNLMGLSTGSAGLSTDWQQRVGISVAGLALLLTLGRTLHFTWRVWPANEEVRFVWQEALTTAARHLDSVPDTTPVAILGWSPTTMDPPTLALSLQRDDLSLRFFGHEHPTPMDIVILPTSPSGVARVVRPAARPFAAALESRLTGWGIVEDHGAFVLYQVHRPAGQPRPLVPVDLAFGQELRLLGYDPIRGEGALTYWEVLRPVSTPRSVFVHLVDGAGQVIAQSDGLEAPSLHWQAGDVILKLHRLPQMAGVEMRVGVYNPQTQTRLTTPAGADYIVLPPPP